MNSKQRILILLGILLIIGVSFLLGLLVGQSKSAKPDLLVTTNGQTFYASIERILQYNDGRIHVSVKGLEVNDINYRGNFTFTIDDNMNMTWRGENINISDLNVGDNISITFSDEMLASISPTPIQKVERIQLLDDEK